MAADSDFTAACKDAARALRRLPAEVRRALGQRMRTEVAAPLAADIAAAWSGPYAGVLAAGTKAYVAADPTIKVGGAHPRLSGGAGPRDLVFGTEFGGGGRVSAVPAHRRRSFPVSSHSRVTTNQFGAAQLAVFGTVEAQIPQILERTADIITDTMDGVIPGG